MLQTPKLELVSFKLCPFVQRSVITLKHKKAPYSITYIDLENPPAWFDEISPMGKVPVLKVFERTVLFESAVINEYIDETVGDPILPTDPLIRAFERAWIAYGSELIGAMYGMTMEMDADSLAEAKAEFFQDLARLEGVLDAEGPWFGGKTFSLADAAYAPLFMRMELSKVLKEDPAWKQMPKVRRWVNALMDNPAVRESVVPEFAQLYVEYCREAGSLLY